MVKHTSTKLCCEWWQSHLKEKSMQGLCQQQYTSIHLQIAQNFCFHNTENKLTSIQELVETWKT